MTNERKIGQLTVEEWCDYWREGNTQYIDDGIGIDNTIRSDLAEASEVIRELLQASRPQRIPPRPDTKSHAPTLTEYRKW